MKTKTETTTSSSSASTTQKWEEKFKIMADKIATYENNFATKYNNLSHRADKQNRIEQKLKALIQMQSDLVEIKSSEKNYMLNKSTIYNCISDNVLAQELSKKPNLSELILEYTLEISDTIITIFRCFNKNIYDNKTVDIELKNPLKKDTIIYVIKTIFTDSKLILDKLNFYSINKEKLGFSFFSNIAWDPIKKNPSIILSDDNKTITHTTPDGHATVLGKEGFSSGCVSWTIRINNFGVTNWICIGVYPMLTSFGDFQTAEGFNIRGGDYDCHQMAPSRTSKIENNDIITCTLDFDNDYFKMVCENKWEVKSTKTIQGLTLFPFAELYYNLQSITIMD